MVFVKVVKPETVEDIVKRQLFGLNEILFIILLGLYIFIYYVIRSRGCTGNCVSSKHPSKFSGSFDYYKKTLISI